MFLSDLRQNETDLEEEDTVDPQFDEIEEDLRIDATQEEIEDDEDRYEPVLNEKDIKHPEYLKWKKAAKDESRKSAKHITRHKAIFRDSTHDQAEVKLFLRGDKVCIQVDDVWEWSGDDFQMLNLPPRTPIHAVIAEDCELFETHHSYLTNFSLTFQLPIYLQNTQTGENKSAVVEVFLEVDHQRPDPQQFQLILQLSKNISFKSDILPSIHNCLTDIKKQLPKHIAMKSCWGCAYANYTPLGTSLFGGLGCFRGNPEMKDRKDVRGIFQQWAKRRRYVQENHLCKQWEVRTVEHLMPKKDEFKKNRFKYDFEVPDEHVPKAPPRPDDQDFEDNLHKIRKAEKKRTRTE